MKISPARILGAVLFHSVYTVFSFKWALITIFINELCVCMCVRFFPPCIENEAIGMVVRLNMHIIRCTFARQNEYHKISDAPVVGFTFQGNITAQVEN